MVEDRHEMVSGSLLREVPDAHPVCRGSQRSGDAAARGGNTLPDVLQRDLPSPDRLQHGKDISISETAGHFDRGKKREMKQTKASVNTADFRIWCERCSIRIAPHEEKIQLAEKTYHSRCYSKEVSPSENAKGAAASKAMRGSQG